MSASGPKRTSLLALHSPLLGVSGHALWHRTCPLLTQGGHVDPIASLLGISLVPYAWEIDVPYYIFLMHDDGRDDENDWAPYLAKLKNRGSFEGGSAIGGGVCIRKSGAVPSLTAHLTGYIRVSADNLDHAKKMLAGNPHFESGGTVEIRELPRTD